MNTRKLRRRTIARDLARAAALLSAVMLVLATWTAVTSGSSRASAAAVAGSLSFTPTSGGSATQYSIALPSGAACSGDSAGANYRVQTYMIPGSADPAGLTFDGSGPIAVSGQTRTPLYSANGDPVVGALTGSAATPGGPGLISGLPTLSFAVFLPGDVTTGTYNVGVACSVGGAGPSQLDKYWNAQLNATTDATDSPANFTWTLGGSGTTTTTTGGGTTTTTESGTTTTTDGGTTTTTTGIVVKVGPPLVLSQDTLKAGDSVTIQAGGWQPSSDVEIFLHSDPVDIGTLTADESGNIDGSVSIPADTPPGTHEIVALGLDTSGEPMGSSADVTVQSAEADPTGGTPSAASPVTTMGQLPYTGSSPLPMVFWAVSLLVFGRMAMLLGKRPKVIGDGRTG
jgi:hypothetical protein